MNESGSVCGCECWCAQLHEQIALGSLPLWYYINICNCKIKRWGFFFPFNLHILEGCFAKFQVALVVKNSPANAEDVRDSGSISGLGRSPGREHGNPLQYYCLENPKFRGAWRATVHRVTKSWTWLKQLTKHACSLRSCPLFPMILLWFRRWEVDKPAFKYHYVTYYLNDIG